VVLAADTGEAASTVTAVPASECRAAAPAAANRPDPAPLLRQPLQRRALASDTVKP